MLVDLQSPMIPAKVQPQGILGSGGEDFLKFFSIYGRGGHLGQRTVTILAIFFPPTLRRLHMKFEQIGSEAPEEKLFEILNIFPIQMHKEAKLTLP